MTTLAYVVACLVLLAVVLRRVAQIGRNDHELRYRQWQIR